MIYRIEVWINLDAVDVRAGEMVCEIVSGRRNRGAFRYAPDYLRRSDAFALDPVSLPLREGDFAVEHPGVFGVFEDSLPDDWGRRLLVRRHRLPLHQQNLPTLLLALGASGLGALSYTQQGAPGSPSAELSVVHLDRLVLAAQAFERGENTDADINLLLGAGSSPGGARPKALVFDAAADEHCLAKFPSIKDNVDVVRIEAATMNLAARAGLVVPPTRLVEFGSRPVLLVRRFDLSPSGRRHMISLQTLLNVSGYYHCRYGDMLNVVRKVSADPQEDSERLFRQMVFNAVVHNTDDHLKNFWMVCDSDKGWRLSPAFDLVPDIGQRGEHVLFFDLDPVYPGRSNLEKLGRAWGIPGAGTIVEHVFSAVAGWREEFAACGVAQKDAAWFAEIDSYLQR
ncbi:type II toxin-antitoxin system HipA family toxin [Trichloromonas sp.]|uniref:type II toxin-antitoxin system HipA family toxin n=1 Tax=Trichloromonas sp. TaxID=3069249 RepID=UPI003D816ED4